MAFTLKHYYAESMTENHAFCDSKAWKQECLDLWVFKAMAIFDMEHSVTTLRSPAARPFYHYCLPLNSMDACICRDWEWFCTSNVSTFCTAEALLISTFTSSLHPSLLSLEILCPNDYILLFSGQLTVVPYDLGPYWQLNTPPPAAYLSDFCTIMMGVVGTS